MACVVSIHDLDGKLAGTGVLVRRNLVLTCAHVVNLALGRSAADQTRPERDRQMQVQFAAAPGKTLTATVDAGTDAWSAPPATRAIGADICLIQLRESPPRGATVARLRSMNFETEFSVRASGYPADWNLKSRTPQIDFSLGKILGLDGYVWLLRADSASILRTILTRRRGSGLIHQGFSGGPVQAGAEVVGLVAEARSQANDGTAYVIPTQSFPPRLLYALEPTAIIAEANIVHPYGLLETELVGRSAALDHLDEWARAEDQQILVVWGMGGLGKSAATWRWFKTVAERLPEVSWFGRMWWSFYQDGADFGAFLGEAVRYLEDAEPSPEEARDWQKLQESFLKTVEGKRYLFVLDGFERELFRYATATRNAIDDVSVDGNEGRPSIPASPGLGGRNLRDLRVQRFLFQLLQTKGPKFLISSRLLPSDLRISDVALRHGVQEIKLTGLTPSEAVTLWHLYGLSGSSATLNRVFHSVAGHPLTIKLLKGAIVAANIPQINGNLDAWLELNPNFRPWSLPLKDDERKAHVLAYALDGVSEPAWGVLFSISLLPRAPSHSLLEAIWCGPEQTLIDEEELLRILNELRARELITYLPDTKVYEIHPVVAGVILERGLSPTQANTLTSLAKHYETLMYKVLPDNEKLDTPIALCRMLIVQRELEQAFSVFKRHLRDSIDRLGRTDLKLELLQPLFEPFPPHAVAVEGHLTSPDDRRLATLLFGKTLSDLGRPVAAVEFLDYHNRTCSSPTCKLHQYSIRYAAGAKLVADQLIREVGSLVRSPGASAPSSEFYLGMWAADHLARRRLMTLAGLAYNRGLGIARSYRFALNDNYDHIINETCVSLLLAAGKWRRAVKVSRSMVKKMEQEGRSALVFAWRDRLGDCLVLSGHADSASEAYQIFSQNLEDSSDRNDTGDQLGSRLGQANALILLGQLDDARAAQLEVLEQAKLLGHIGFVEAAHRTGHRAALAQSDEQNAIWHAREIVRCYADFDALHRDFPHLRDALRYLLRCGALTESAVRSMQWHTDEWHSSDVNPRDSFFVQKTSFEPLLSGSKITFRVPWIGRRLGLQ